MSKDSFKNGQRASIRLYVISITGSQGYNKAPAEKRWRLEILVNTRVILLPGPTQHCYYTFITLTSSNM